MPRVRAARPQAFSCVAKTPRRGRAKPLCGLCVAGRYADDPALLIQTHDNHIEVPSRRLCKITLLEVYYKPEEGTYEIIRSN